MLGIFSSVPLSAFLAATPARAQEALLDDMSNETAAQSRTQQAQMQDYSFKSGDFRLLLVPALSLQWNDNINATETDKQSDFIVLPTLGIVMSYPLTKQNLLQLNVTAGYNEYLNHPHLSSWYLQAGSGLSFNFYIKDILFNLHDNFSYVQNTTAYATVAGTGTFGTFENTAGLFGEWSLRDIQFTLGYDHINTLATTGQFNNTDSSTESIYGRAGYTWNSKLTTGVEGTFSYMGYNQNVLNNNTMYSAGVYGDWQPDKFLHVEPRVGYTIAVFQQTSQQLQTANLSSWYADLNISHQITKQLSYSIDGGHNIAAGVQSDANEYWYANANVTWNFIRGFSFQPSVFYQHGNQGIGSTVLPAGDGNLVLLQQNEIYNWYGGQIGFSYAITKRFTASINYQITQRTSSIPDRGYTENVIGIQLTYHPI